MKLAVFGGDGATGRNVVSQALERGWSVRAIERDAPDHPQQHDNLAHREADVLKDDLRDVINGCDAVVSALGVGLSPSNLLDPPPLYTKGTEGIVDGMRHADVKRLVVISATFVESGNRGPLHFRLPAMIGLNQVFEQMADMERFLRRCDDIEWTAVRPGWLMEGDRTEDYVVQSDVIPPDLIRTRRADLAHFMLECIANAEWIRQTPAIARAESNEATSLKAVAREFAAA